ncbi:uncharacterized protein [Lolium perenne]|uniref:uncharacterized protein n=1 Tax=Lolium perenne TaxID=4522 RepID=UPI003A99ECDD
MPDNWNWGLPPYSREQPPELAVTERRTVLYNKVVTSYHKAKIERAGLARELEAVKAEAARIPQLESDLRVARAQCATSEEANRAAAAKLKVADGELKRLRLLEANHLKELAALKKEQEEKLEGLSKRLEEVERQRLSLQQEVTTKSNELSATAKRWLGELSALDRGLAAAFPEAQEEALAAVGRAREDRRQATGEQSSGSFTMDDYRRPSPPAWSRLHKDIGEFCAPAAGCSLERLHPSGPVAG